MPKAMPKDSLRRRLVLVTLLLPFAACWLVWVALHPGSSLGVRASSALLAAAMVAFVARVLYVAVRRRLQTGQWTITKDECADLRLRRAAEPLRPWTNVIAPSFLVIVAVINGASYTLKLAQHRANGFDNIVLAVWVLIGLSQVWLGVWKLREHRSSGVNP